MRIGKKEIFFNKYDFPSHTLDLSKLRGKKVKRKKIYYTWANNKKKYCKISIA